PIPSVYAIWVADCVPMFFWNERGTVFGLAHIGWRGAAQQFAAKFVEKMRKEGISNKDMRIAVGPHIHSCCYPVGPEVAQQFPYSSLICKGDNIFLDLSQELIRQIDGCGISLEHLSISEACTSCRSDEFFSYRRDKSDLRMMAFIASRGDRGQGLGVS
ncbi:MAG: polyphenol oxidase family protein, partial [Elusimicrobia bacterium]|nr:polyphenol oxidase family protein [Elusimicrobiota bacterium]